MERGDRLGAYEVLGPLGAGGMGEVYRARDLRLGREVALKVLSSAIARSPDSLSRFEREARALAALTHPHVAVLHGLEEAGEERFLVMELVRGEALDRRLGAGALPVADAVDLAAQIADALEAAHASGIVHRDLKPSNVMVGPRGDVKLLDFGLSKLLDEQPPDAGAADRETELMTRAGMVMGTAPYMSPEQASGRPVDARTDVWSFGCLLFEMLSGRRPFDGPSMAETLAAILAREPDWDRLPDGTPEEVCRLLRRCLRKDPHERLQSIGEARVELRELAAELTRGDRVAAGGAPRRAEPPPPRAWRRRRALSAGGLGLLAAALVAVLVAKRAQRPAGSAQRPEVRSIAVLPLASDSADPDQAYFVDGMTEALINDLATLGIWKVISRTSVMHYRENPAPLPVIGRELGVDAVVEGSVLQAGERVRVTARLIHVASEEILWAGAYERQLADIVTLQRQVARAVAGELAGRLSPEVAGKLAQERQVDPETHLLYMKGRYLWNERTGSALEEAIAHFQRVLQRDPNHALAWAGLAESYVLLPGYGIGAWSPRVAFPLAREAALRAIALDDSIAGAHATLGYTSLMWEWDWESSEREFRRAIELNPSYANAYFWYSICLSSRGRGDDAIAMAQKAVELDPVSPILAAGLGHAYRFAGDYERAIAAVRPVLELNPRFALLHHNIAVAYRLLGRHRLALEHYRKAVPISGESPDLIAELGVTLAKAGELEEARRVLQRLEALAEERYVSAYSRATLHLALGEREQALRWLDEAVEERSWVLPFVAVDPNLFELHGEPRFEAIARRVVGPSAADLAERSRSRALG